MRAFVVLIVVSSTQAFPLWFEPNQGQAHASVQFLSRNVYLSSNKAAIRIDDAKPIVLSLIGARSVPAEGLDPQSGITSYFLGNDPKKWHAGIPHYARVRYKAIYPWIDLIYYHNTEGQLEYDFVISPGADPTGIVMAWNQPVHEDRNGDLLIGGVRQKRPKVYQNGQEIAAAYEIQRNSHVRLAVASYDHSQTLTVDPVLVYSTYLGGPADEWGSGIKVDSSGSAYITGSSRAAASPSLNPFQQVGTSSEAAYVLKLTPSGNAVVFYVVLGGSGNNYSEGIDLDSTGNAWIAGMTQSLDFPVKNASQPVYGGGFDDGFCAKVSADGRSIVFSTYVGGLSDDWARGVAVSPDGSGWVAGYTRSIDFPKKNPLQPALASAPDAFLQHLSSDGKLLFSTYIGGDALDFGTGVASDADGNAYIAGITTSDDYPVKNALQPQRQAKAGQSKTFLTKISAGGAVVYSTFLCGSAPDCGALRVAVDAQGNAYAFGIMQDGLNVKNAAQAVFGGGDNDKFVIKVSPDGQSIVYATYLGGSNAEYGYGGLAFDKTGNLYLAGHTTSPDFPTKNPVQGFTAQGSYVSGNVTITELTPDGSLLFSTPFGGSGNEFAQGIAVDSTGAIWITGQTTSSDFPVKNAIQTTYAGGGGDIFIAKFAPDALPTSPFMAAPIVLPFRYVVGGSPPPSQTISVTSATPGLTFTVSTTSSWLKVASSSPTTPATLTVSVVPMALSPGQYSGEIQIDSQTRVQVNLNVLAPAPNVTGVAPQNVPVGADTTIITVTGSGFQQGAVVQVNGVAFPTTFVDSGTLQFTLDKSNLKLPATFAITVVNPQSVPSTPLTFAVGTPPPQFTAASITNAASFTNGPIAPGEIVSIFGANLMNAVTFDGLPATLVFSSPTQVNVTVPYSIVGPTNVLQMGASSVQLQVAPSAPGIFAAVASDGGIVTLYATGCGTLTNDDLPRCALPVSVTVNAESAQVLYAGIAPGLVQGANQINIQLPDDIASGQLTIVLTAGDVASKPFSFTFQ